MSSAERNNIYHHENKRRQKNSLSEVIERRVDERTRELKNINYELDSFNHTISHEIKAHIRAIDVYARIFIEDYGAQLDSQSLGLIQNIRNICQEMIDLNNKLLEYASIARKEPDKEIVNMEKLIFLIFNELRKNYKTDRKILLDFETSIPSVIGDSLLLKQAVTNIISNALKFTRNREASIISVGFKKENGEELFYVRDNGVGFDMKFAEKLFGLFKRLHSDDEFAGTGIGLAIVKKIINIHGGRVWMEGDVGKGATVYFTLKALFEIRYPVLLFSDPVYIADELGYFKDEGIRINFTEVLDGTDIIASVATGANDFGGNHASRFTVMVAKGYKIKAIAAGWASTKDNPVLAWLVRDDSPIKTPQNLIGKKVATMHVRLYPWLELLAKYNILQDTFNTVCIPYEKQEQALRSGQVDAIFLIKPFLQKALKGGGLRLLADATDGVGIEAGWPQQFVNTDFLKNHPDIVKKFVTAYARAVDWTRAHPKEAGQIFAKRLGAPPEYSDYYTAAYPEHALIDEKNAQLYLDLAIKYGDVNKGQITTSDIYTNEYNPYYQP
ncbi:MAG: ABC transporter substrate-binding protein [Thermacetogeniaceae bacterium]